MPCCIHLGCRGAGSPPVSCEARLRPPNRSEKVVTFRAGGLAPHPFATAARLWKRLNFPRQPGVGSCQPSLGSTKHGIVRIRAEHQCWNRNQLYGRRSQTDAGLSAGGRQWVSRAMRKWCCQTNSNQFLPGQQCCPLCRADTALRGKSNGVVEFEIEST